jgi:hypothetical protein
MRAMRRKLGLVELASEDADPALVSDLLQASGVPSSPVPLK